jgi:UDP-N-acetylglucosamine 2-epimerase (non-hydrolysing)
MSRKRICILFGTRPEIIKMSPLIRVCERQSVDHFVLHTGQHSTYEMDEIFFRDLKLSAPTHKLDSVAKVSSRTPARVLAAMLVGVEDVLSAERPDVVLVPSDPHATLAGAVIAAHLQIPVGHVESGLRSRDWTMPEEINRIMTDHISTYLFAPTEPAAAILRSEGIPAEKIHVTGNTVVDALLEHLPIAKERSTILADHGLAPGYVLWTTHRAENLNDRSRLSGILTAMERVLADLGGPLVFPIHPSTENALTRYGFQVPRGVKVIPPVGYLDFLVLQSAARLVVTDSGGIQEETTILRVPCVTLRDNTERPESVEAGGNLLAGTDPEAILRSAREMLSRPRDWKNPFGDGHAAERIISIVSGA